MNTTVTPARSVQLPGLDINAYEHEGRSKISMSEICKYSRGNKNVNPFKNFLERTGSEALPPSGSEGFPQAESTGSIRAEVLRPNGSTVEAELIPPEVAALFMASELMNPRVSDEVKARAVQFMVITSATGLRGLADEALGLNVDLAGTAQQISLLVKTGHALPASNNNEIRGICYEASGLKDYPFPINELHKTTGLPKDDQKYLGNVPKNVIKSLISRLGPGAYSALNKTRNVSTRTHGGRYRRSLEECMTPEAKKEYSLIVRTFKMLVQARAHRIPFTPLDYQEILSILDNEFPSY